MEWDECELNTFNSRDDWRFYGTPGPGSYRVGWSTDQTGNKQPETSIPDAKRNFRFGIGSNSWKDIIQTPAPFHYYPAQFGDEYHYRSDTPSSTVYVNARQTQEWERNVDTPGPGSYPASRSNSTPFKVNKPIPVVPRVPINPYAHIRYETNVQDPYKSIITSTIGPVPHEETKHDQNPVSAFIHNSKFARCSATGTGVTSIGINRKQLTVRNRQQRAGLQSIVNDSKFGK